MGKELKRYGITLAVLYAVYAVVSYLIFLRDDFLLERIAFLTDSPGLLEKGRELAKLLHVNSIPTLLYFLTVTAMFVVYAKALRLLRNQSSGQSTSSKIVLRYAAAFLITTFLSFPALSTDVFDYIASNRVLFVHHANPWIEPPQNFPQDPFIYLGSWKFRASVYGPVQFLTSSLIHVFAKDDLLMNVIGFKFMGGIFTLATIVLLKKWFQKYSPDNFLYGLALFAWNPLIHIEIVGNAHNDMVMAFFSLLGFYWFFEGRLMIAAAALALAVLAKVVAILFVPIFGWWLFLQGKRRDAVRFLSWFSLMTLGGFLSLGEGLRGFIGNLGVQLELYLRSFPTAVRFMFLKMGFEKGQAVWAEKLVTIPPFLLLLTGALSRIRRTGVIAGMVVIILLYLVLVSPMLQPWYLAWILPFAAILPRGRLQAVVLLSSYTSLLYYAVLFASFYLYPLNFFWQIAMLATIALPPLILGVIPQRWYTERQ